MAEPIRNPCGHEFCLSCHMDYMKVNMCCPMCRKPLEPHNLGEVCVEKQCMIERRFPKKFEERKKELINLKKWRGNNKHIAFAYGNTHK